MRTWHETPESSSISRFKYDEAEQILTIEFTSGSIYEYSEVPNFVFYEMIDSKSTGKFFHTEIKNWYDYKKID
jgi:hypothetical protein